MFVVKKYQPSNFEIWNTFVSNAKNATFLFHRDFMEYHNDRFTDYSLMIYNGESLIALLPANVENDVLYSHQGLTYGGLLFLKSIGFTKVKTIFNTIVQFLKQHNFSTIQIKLSPLFYHKIPTYELEALLHKQGGELYLREQNLAIDYSIPLNIHKTKLKHFRKNQNKDFVIKETSSFSDFWEQVLIPRLKIKHKTKPIHTVNEISYLNEKFPKNIIQYNIYLGNEIMAGITIFKTDTVVKSQYGAVTDKGEKYRALDYLFMYLIQKFKDQGYRYFDMGTVVGNMSLLKQKEELGCNQYLQDFYKINIL